MQDIHRLNSVEERRVDLLEEPDRARCEPPSPASDAEPADLVSPWSTWRSTRPLDSWLRTTCEVIFTSVPANAARAICDGC